jgi:hypothetical protein
VTHEQIVAAITGAEFGVDDAHAEVAEVPSTAMTAATQDGGVTK